ncbi:MAG: polysaccharide deacetylase family protein [Candidatus Omnitrophota bacterium]|nr:polysaccharide deacetylase family protein [Candidatus Omnitrophota bacterium]
MKKRMIIIVAIVSGLALLGLPVRKHYVVPILMYHRIDKEDSLTSKLAVSPQVFRKQMSFLARNKYNVIALNQLVSLIKAKSRIPQNTVVITFDDGNEDNYSQAYPILKEYNLPATIFIIVDFIGKPGYMNEGQLKELAQSGLIALGSHTMTHPVLTKIDESLLDKEISGSKKALEERTGFSVKLLSYPLGAFNESVRRKVIEAGYKGAVATNPGKNYPNDDIHALKRMRISENAGNLFVFWAETSGYYTFIKEHRDD